MATTALTASHRESSVPPASAAGVVVVAAMGVAEAVGREAAGELI
jgi:hypothetical protein